jgi:predicted nuclease with TOPRIM domain
MNRERQLEATIANLKRSIDYLDKHRIPPLFKDYMRTLRRENEELRDKVAARDREIRQLNERIRRLEGGN